MSDRRPTFQEAVARLQEYWARQGCVVWLPHNCEVGAGTMNPGTFLYVLGPEPWNVVYVEPSIRPDDARYGENPNRMGRHHQLQVILKPDPGDPQGLYLESLAAIGIDLARHDVRFVEDNWESPALGAWGLGWEVWLDGLEITQFTYFQQAGSLDLDPNSVEITYGIERILMALQDVTHFADLAWNEHLRFGDVLLAYEQQTSRYYFETADIARLRRLFDDSEAEAVSALRNGLVRPAYDYVLRCSHLFNVLDARGAVGVTERAAFFGRMRRLSREVAEGYMEERRTLGFPLLRAEAGGRWIAAAGSPAPAPPTPSTTPSVDDPEGAPAVEDAANGRAGSVVDESVVDFVLEVGTEELPVDDLEAALSSLGDRFGAFLDELRLAHGAVVVGGTPRRLAVMVSDLARRQTDQRTYVVGPAAAVAFDAAGRPTRAGEGFARSVGLAPDCLDTVERGGELRVAAVRTEPGRLAAEVLGPAIAGLLGSLPFGRTIRWNASGQTFSRPVRWLLALHGTEVVPIEFAGLIAGRSTRGPRPLGSPKRRLAGAGQYRAALHSDGIVLDPAERSLAVARQAQGVAGSVGGAVPDESDLLREVTDLVEQPKAILGRFDPEYMELPAAVLVTVLRKHQRCFPVVSGSGELMPYFVAVANGASLDESAVRHGNEAVVRARFADAAYFWRQDTSRPLAEFTERLSGLTFHTDLGSVLDKVRRLERLVPLVGRRLGLSPSELAAASRAAALSKSDLATAMVVDFTSLQGRMGAEYALRSGEPAEVAAALEEQYRPRGALDALPESGPGTALAVADRLDSLVGLFAVGLRPSGAQDPYALRRAALGICAILVGRQLSFDLHAAVDDAAAGLPAAPDARTRSELIDFLARRLEGMLREAGHAADAVAAVLAASAGDPWAAAHDVAVLERWVARPDWSEILTGYARCARIVRGQEGVGDEVDAPALQPGAEQDLWLGLERHRASMGSADADEVLAALADLAPLAHRFFDSVLVMADDPAVRANRLVLVAEVARLPRGIADLSLLEGF